MIEKSTLKARKKISSSKMCAAYANISAMRILLLVLLGWFTIGDSPALLARDFNYDDFKCAFKTPDGWITDTTRNGTIVCVSSDQRKRIINRILPNPSIHAWSEFECRDFDRGLTSAGWSVDRRDHILIQGVPFYVVEASRADAENTVHMKLATGIANHYTYAIGSFLANGDPGTDEDLEASFESFHFLGTPDFSVETAAAQLPFEKRSLAFKIGYVVGWLSGSVITIGALVALVAAILIVGFRLGRKPRNLPPIGAVPRTEVPPLRD